MAVNFRPINPFLKVTYLFRIFFVLFSSRNHSVDQILKNIPFVLARIDYFETSISKKNRSLLSQEQRILNHENLMNSLKIQYKLTGELSDIVFQPNQTVSIPIVRDQL